LFVKTNFFFAIADGYIDDVITVVLDIGDWVAKAANAAPLAIDSLFRPLDLKDPLPRNDPVSIRKLKGEGTPSERKIVLGWVVDSRKFRIYLPEDKGRAWMEELDEMLGMETIGTEVLERTIGRLNHAGYVIPQGRFFLNRLRQMLQRCKRYGPQKPPVSTMEDVKLWKSLLRMVVEKGVDINSVTFTEPTEVCISDTCEFGIGGYDMSGFAWRYELPKEMIGRLTINLLEFVASAITIHLTIMRKGPSQKILALTDSSSAMGWLYKASFKEKMGEHDAVARWLAGTMIENEAALYSQHIRGCNNFVADSLSRDHHLSDEQLTFAYRTLLPLQTPQNFSISPLPTEIDCWLQSLSRTSTWTQDVPPLPTRSKLGVLIAGSDSWEIMGFLMNSCLSIHEGNKQGFCPRLQALAVEIGMARRASDPLKGVQSNPPSRMYARPFGKIFGQTQG
jgi:hypothetical protein